MYEFASPFVGAGRNGYGRLARQARFKGRVRKKRSYVMVDDFVGQGGTLANLRGWIEYQDARVVGAVLVIMSLDGRFGRGRCFMFDLDDACELLAAAD